MDVWPGSECTSDMKYTSSELANDTSDFFTASITFLSNRSVIVDFNCSYFALK